MAKLEHDRLVSRLVYDPESGIFYRNGKRAGGKHCAGYRQIGIDGALYLEHRLAWFYVTGQWPFADIDHIDGVRSNNAFSNLREASRAQNKQNENAPYVSNLYSGLRGVSWHVAGKCWQARIRANGKNLNLGTFKCKVEAHQAYVAAKQQLHPFATNRV